MKGVLNAWCQQLWARHGLSQETVPLAACVHYGAFRYGCGEYNPYESFLVDLVREGDGREARRRLLEFLQHYRPRDLGEALGVRLAVAQPLWRFPWDRSESSPAWVDRLEECPDILTHFLSRGVPVGRLEQEFGWLVRALGSIRDHGYRPERFKNTVLARKLVRADGKKAYLLLDGNHRVAAMAALGYTEVAVSCPPWLVVREYEVANWVQVRRGTCPPEDARRILGVYFTGNKNYRTTDIAAAVWEGAS